MPSRSALASSMKLLYKSPILRASDPSALPVPAAVRSLAGMVAANCVALTKLVVSGVPLKSTVEPLTKPLPVAVMVVLPLPATAEFGLMLLSVGVGLG